VIYCELKNKKHISASSTTYANNILTGSRTDVTLESLDAPSLFSIFTAAPDKKPDGPGQTALNQLKSLNSLKGK
jgi:hypothetical protein